MKILYLVMIFSLVYFSCDPNSNGKLPPPAEVLMVDKFTDLGTIERGIDAVPDKDGIYIEWNLLQNPDVTFYNIYRKSKNESIFSKLYTIPVENIISPFDTLFSYIDDTNIVLDNPNDFVYYYYVTASNKDGVEGSKPDSLTRYHYMLYSKPSTENSQDINIGEQPVFVWHYQGGNIPNYYIIRIEDLAADTLVWTRRFLNEGFGPDKEKDLSTVSNPPVFQSSSIYRWRIDTVGPDSLYSGSESNWKTFFVN